MTLGEYVDKGLIKAKGLAPYVICLSSIALGLGVFTAGAGQASAFPWAATLMVWAGSLLTMLGIGMLIGWHFFQYPDWFQIGKPRTQRSASAGKRRVNDSC
jgi:hypothetical protein